MNARTLSDTRPSETSSGLVRRCVLAQDRHAPTAGSGPLIERLAGLCAWHDSSVDTPPPPPPGRSDVRDLIDRLLAGLIGREAASTWAMRWVAADDPGIEDEAVWEALTELGGVDLTHGEGHPYLYSDDQLREWRDALG